MLRGKSHANSIISYDLSISVAPTQSPLYKELDSVEKVERALETRSWALLQNFPGTQNPVGNLRHHRFNRNICPDYCLP